MKVCSIALAIGFFLAVTAVGATPPVGEHGVQTDDMDTTLRAGDDFFGYANGGWLKRATIPADKPAWGAFAALADVADHRTDELLEGLTKSKKSLKAGSDEQKIEAFYESYMDEAGIDAKGIAPIEPALAAIFAIKDKLQLAQALGQSLRVDVDPMNNINFFTENLFGLWVGPAFADSDHFAAYLLQGGLGLPDRSYYLSGDPKMVRIRAAYLAHIAKMLALCGVADAGEKAEHIMALETAIAKTLVNRADSENVLKANNQWSRSDFVLNAPGLEWDAFFQSAGLSQVSTISVWQPGAIEGIASLVANSSLEDWKDYLAFHLLNHFADVLPKSIDEEHFAMYGATLLGTPSQEPRWKRAVSATNSALGWAVGRLYVARYFPPASKVIAQTMVKTIIAAFDRRIDKLDWMSPTTKAKAKDKLAALYVGVGYPDKWRSYDAYDVVIHDAFGNQQRGELFKYQYWVSRIGTVVDRAEWCMTPQTVNAVNLPLQNALNIPAAIFDPPFFDPNADLAFNYGAIGSIIGHEISHSFDDEGRLFDAKGGRNDWWTPTDAVHFSDAASHLAEQFDAYHPFSDLAVNGQQTLSENIADIAGLLASYDAWLATLKGGPPPVIEGLSGPQRFFLAYAQTRAIAIREPALRRQVLTDGHAPSQYRADTVRNADAWYDAFSVTRDQKLFLTPENRVRLW